MKRNIKTMPGIGYYGYYTSCGYLGFFPDGSRKFYPTQSEYLEDFDEWLEDHSKN